MRRDLVDGEETTLILLTNTSWRPRAPAAVRRARLRRVGPTWKEENGLLTAAPVGAQARA